jgi:MORN repeat
MYAEFSRGTSMSGFILFPDGGRYEGNLVGVAIVYLHNQGVYTWPNGDRYDGLWYCGFRNGFGEMIFADGSEWQGNWHHGTRIGTSPLSWDNYPNVVVNL